MVVLSLVRRTDGRSETKGKEMNRFFGAMVLCMAIGFFCIFLAVNASISGDSLSFGIGMMLGVGAVSLGMGLNKYGRYIESVRRLERRTDEIRGQYERT